MITEIIQKIEEKFDKMFILPFPLYLQGNDFVIYKNEIKKYIKQSNIELLTAVEEEIKKLDAYDEVKCFRKSGSYNGRLINDYDILKIISDAKKY